MSKGSRQHHHHQDQIRADKSDPTWRDHSHRTDQIHGSPAPGKQGVGKGHTHTTSQVS